MRSLAVVVREVLSQHCLKVMLADDHQPIQRFVPESLDYPLAMGVRARSSIWGENDLPAFGPEHLVEIVDELAVPVVDEELDR